MTGRRRLPDLAWRLPQTRAALAYAEQQHAGQRRTADGAAFILHPLEVAKLLYDAGAPDHVIAAGALHDTIEKTGADASELRWRLGSRIASLVLAVSEDPWITGYRARKAALRNQVVASGPEALMGFAADKISKVRELGLVAARRPQDGLTATSSRRLTHYRHCLELLEVLLADSPLVAQLRAEFDELRGTVSPRRRSPALADHGLGARGRHGHYA